MSRLILVRHAETKWNQQRRIQGGGSNIPLNEKGLVQAQDIANYFDGQSIKAVYTSPLLRASVTAEAIAQRLKLETIHDERLKEIDAGELEGVAVAEVGDRFSKILASGEEKEDLPRLPGGETLKELQERAWSAVEDILHKHSDETVILVTHYFVIVTIICAVLELPLWRIDRFRLGNGSISVIERKDGVLRLIRFNEIPNCSEEQPL
jgi:broad specificity phosphatase PhoE